MTSTRVTVSIPAPSASDYPVLVGPGALRELSAIVAAGHYSKVVILSDLHVAPHWLKAAKGALQGNTAEIVVEPGESKKNLSTVESVWAELLRLGADRTTLLINLGGGVIGDLGGFAASCYMRGIPFIQAPTTLLAQVDASVGGKLGVDFSGRKNFIGSFAQPVAVICDTHTLSTLPARELTAGFAEILKHGALFDRDYFARASMKAPSSYGEAELAELVTGSVRLKAAIVAKDPHERGPRKLLNFGHTIGHAIESLSFASTTPLLHGEAISIGMVAEATLAQTLGKLAPQALQALKEALRFSGLPISAPFPIENAKVFELIKSDKKNRGGIVLWTIIDEIGRGSFDITAPDTAVVAALDCIRG